MGIVQKAYPCGLSVLGGSKQLHFKNHTGRAALRKIKVKIRIAKILLIQHSKLPLLL